jgi:5-dehydro-4-deoxyglucarate dehydratase
VGELNPGELKSRLVGVIAFCPTPFREDQGLELGGLALQIDFLCETAASSVVVCGGVGEFYALDADEHRAVVETAVQASRGRLPVIVGIGASTRAACRLAEHAAAAGAAGLLVNPLHFVEPEREGLRLHYEAIGAASALGTIVFSHRLATHDVGTLHALAGVETVIGLKDEYGDLRTFVQARAELGDRLAWINGTGEVLALAYLAAGAQAMTSGIVNFAPELTFAVWNAGAEGRFADVRELVARYVQPISELRERRSGYSTTVVKEAMNLRGRPGGAVRTPLVPLRPDERAELRLILERLAPLAASAMPALVGR